MKFIKQYSIFELNTKTYLSAANRLEVNHPKRANNLRKWVDEKQLVDIPYIDPRPIYTNDNIYYVTSVDVFDSPIGVNNKYIMVILESPSDSVNLTINNWISDNVLSINNQLKIHGVPWMSYNMTKDPSLDKEFYCRDRKSAIALKDIIESESGEKVLCSVNDFYKS